MPTITPELRQLIFDLSDRGITVEPVEDRLRLRPREAVDDALLERIREHKDDLLEIMRIEYANAGSGNETPAGDSENEGIDSASSDIDEIVARLLAEPRPPSPSPDDWIRGRGITPEAVGEHRFQHGGRPHALRRELRLRWLDAYVEAMQVMSEPEAWAEAWRAIK